MQKKSRLLLNTQSCYQFLAGFLGGREKGYKIFLGNSKWKETEWEAVLRQVKPELILEENGLKVIASSSEVSHGEETKGTIMIPTGGSSGKIRFVEHNWDTLSASVKGFCRYFEEEKINCFCTLPLYHVSGFMQFMRSYLTGGHLMIHSYKSIEIAWRNQDQESIHQLEKFPQQDYFISLVPTQLQRLLNWGAEKWLSQFQCVLLGGAPPWESLLETARAFKIPIALTYGLTETASGIVTLKPRDFLAGNNSVGKVLPHAKVSIQEETGNIGRIIIKSESLGLGYYPDIKFNEQEFITDDLGYFDPEGYLYIVGRKSRKIITGGENVFPEEVERAILSTGLVSDVLVMGLKDENWGEVVSAVYVPKGHSVVSDEIKRHLKQHLSDYKIPKQWLEVKSIPRNELGKLDKTAE